jgi:hypothetical protein
MCFSTNRRRVAAVYTPEYFVVRLAANATVLPLLQGAKLGDIVFPFQNL